jgi:hypothetical protein
MPATMAIGWHHLWRGRDRDYFGLVFIQRGMATAAEIITGTELNQQAVITTDNFP